MFEIRSYFIILISGFLSVFLYLKKKNYIIDTEISSRKEDYVQMIRKMH